MGTFPLDDPQYYVIVAGQTVLTVWREFQFYVGLSTFNALITITALALNQMKETLIESLKIFDENSDDVLESGKVNYSRQLEVVITSVQAYDCLQESSKNMRQCFGIQMLFSLFSLSLFYIFLCYRGITSIMALVMDLKGGPNHIIIVLQLINFMGAIVSVLRAGQMLHNAMEELRRSTAKLSHKLVISHPLSDDTLT
ncbi:uncharacterized protein [Choristoneura fumiferana]|uniref:uncharacterized protein n=1 Tax=Choristoneura fumiferana TaxID=7141 RepID=UPI003D157271